MPANDTQVIAIRIPTRLADVIRRRARVQGETVNGLLRRELGALFDWRKHESAAGERPAAQSMIGGSQANDDNEHDTSRP
jgi:hypothetical protein